MIWDAHDIAALAQHRALGMSLRQIGKAMGRSRSSIAGAVSRHVHKVRDPRLQRSGKRGRKSRTWTEELLTEPWAQRKARRARELESQ